MSSLDESRGRRRWLLAGRWVLLAAAAAGTAWLVGWQGTGINSNPVLLILLVYAVASLILVLRKPIVSVPVPALLFLDLIFVGGLAFLTGGSRSPVLSLFIVVIFMAALVRDLAGGLAAGAVAACISALLVLGTPGGWRSALPPLVPALLIAGLTNGYLARGMRSGARRLGESLIREKQQELEERLAERERAVEARVVQKEMDLAHAMQLAALPAAVPSVPGLEIAARAELAQEVGGDFYMFLQDGDRTEMVLGDVSGKGIPAAFTATSVAYLLPWLKPLQDPLTALRNLNTDLIQHLPEASFVTLVMAEVDTAAGTLHIWNAGHPPALVWRASTGQVETCTSKGPLLGIISAWDGEPQAWPFEAGDVLLLYSDGLSEVRNPDKVMFDGRIRDVLATNSAKPAEVIVETLFQAVRTWGEPSDDLTILVCRRT